MAKFWLGYFMVLSIFCYYLPDIAIWISRYSLWQIGGTVALVGAILFVVGLWMRKVDENEKSN